MPPFEGLPAVMWCYFVFSYIALPRNPIWLGDLPDPDDYTYLTQTLDWLQGQSWFDNIQHRMSPPEGVAIHYTRLAEMPLAGVILIFRLFHYSWHGAAMLASYLLPVVYLGLMFMALRFAASRLINPDWARLTAFVVMFAPALTFKFAPGQVDHHGLEAILTILAVGASIQMFACPDQMRWSIGAGALFALATAIALEVLPWMALTSGIVGLWTTLKGTKAARSALLFGITLFLVSACLLALERPLDQIFQADLLSYSIAYVGLTGGIALALLAAACIALTFNLKLRCVLAGSISLVLGAIYLWHFPLLLSGPYGAMDKRLADLFFFNLEEAQPLIERYTFYKGLLLMATPLLALGVCPTLFTKARDEKKWGWLLIGSLLSASIMLALYYQIRVLIYALLFSIIPLLAYIELGWDWLSAHRSGRGRFWAEIALILTIGPLSAILLPALQDGRSFNTGIILFPAQTFDDSCQMMGLDKLLNAPSYTARAPLRILSVMDQGPELLFRTPHTILSAPYHTNVRGNLDVLDFFSTADPTQAQQIARRDGINLVVLCRNIPDMYLQGSGPHYALLPDGEVKMLPNASFAAQLAFHHVPNWLTELQVPTPADYLAFEVKD